jgi:hypothetical protein
MGLLPVTLLLMILGFYVVRLERKFLMTFVIVSIYSFGFTLPPTNLLLTGLLSRNDRVSTQPNHHSLWARHTGQYGWEGYDVALCNYGLGTSCPYSCLFDSLFRQFRTRVEADYCWKRRKSPRLLSLSQYWGSCTFSNRAHKWSFISCLEGQGLEEPRRCIYREIIISSQIYL